MTATATDGIRFQTMIPSGQPRPLTIRSIMLCDGSGATLYVTQYVAPDGETHGLHVPTADPRMADAVLIAATQALALQAAEPLRAENAEAVVLIPSASEPGVRHRVVRRRDGSWACDCKGYEHRGTCRHLTEAVAQIGM